MKNRANAAHSSVPLREIKEVMQTLLAYRTQRTGSCLSRNPKRYESAESIFLDRAPQAAIKFGRAAHSAILRKGTELSAGLVAKLILSILSVPFGLSAPFDS